MPDQADLVALTREMHERFTAATEGVDAATLETAPVCGVWSARDVAGHLVDWVIEMIGTAAGAIGESHTPDPLVGDDEAFNLAHAAAHSNEPWSTTKSNLDAAIERAIALIQRTTPQQLELPVDFPLGGSGSLSGLLSGVAGHHEEHILDLETWRAARG